MSTNIATGWQASTNPFSPSFGNSPLELIGREGLLTSITNGLASGPTSRDYNSLLLGPRGSGKTVILSELRNQAAARGWIVLALDATTKGIESRLKLIIEAAKHEYDALEDVTPDSPQAKDALSGFQFGPIGISRQILPHIRTDWDAKHMLLQLARHAQKHDVGVLMTLDELHSGDREELRRFSADLQYISNDSGYPLAVVAAGLAEMKYTLLLDKKMTFFRRCTQHDMPEITLLDAIKGLNLHIRAAGGKINENALHGAAKGCGILPYKMQLVGHACWEIAGAPAQPIDMESTQLALQIADEEMFSKVVEPAWSDLSINQQHFLMRIAEAGGRCEITTLLDRLDPSTDWASIYKRLLGNGYIQKRGRTVLELTELMPSDAVEELMSAHNMFNVRDAPGSGDPPILDLQDLSSLSRSTCGIYMPVAKAYCVLCKQHAGGCRSRK